MSSRFRTWLGLAACVWAAALAAVCAPPVVADGDGTSGPQAPPPAPKEPGAPQADAEALVARLQELYVRASRVPAGLDPSIAETDKARAKLARETGEWEAALRELSRAGDDYLTAIGSAAPDANALYYRGVGKALLATRQGRAEAPATREAAADSLRRYLDAAPKDAAFRAQAELHLGKVLVHQSSADERRLEEAVPHLRRAVAALQEKGDRDGAGEAAYFALSALVGRGREGDAQALAEEIGAREADFGASTPSVRKLAALTLVVPGGRLPKLPDVKDVDGAPIRWADFAGSPFVIHFFKAGEPTGRKSGFRDVELDLAPLWNRLRDKGLEVVGVSMDYLQPAKKAEEMRKNWEEWGVKGAFHDGSLESVRKWAAAQPIGWPWYWDGMWLKNPLSESLGGVGANSPYAILVDRAGVVRWRGAPTRADGCYDGLDEEAEKACAAKK
jgi:hypothetical protein